MATPRQEAEIKKRLAAQVEKVKSLSRSKDADLRASANDLENVLIQLERCNRMGEKLWGEVTALRNEKNALRRSVENLEAIILSKEKRRAAIEAELREERRGHQATADTLTFFRIELAKYREEFGVI